MGGSNNGTAVAGMDTSMVVTTAAPSPVLVLTVGHTIFRTLVETAQREGIDVNSLGVALLMLGLGRQTAVVTRSKHVTTDDAPNTPVRTVCINCGRSRSDPRQSHCATCGGGWCTSFG